MRGRRPIQRRADVAADEFVCLRTVSYAGDKCVGESTANGLTDE
jgi:hypothetical protein